MKHSAHPAKVTAAPYRDTAYISYLNVISAIAVVILHTNDMFWAYRPNGSWRANNVVECIFFFAVPIFFMLSGATLVDYPQRYDTKTFFIKRLKKSVVPFLFWSFAPFFLSLAFPKFYHVDTKFTFQNVFNGTLNYYWFYYFWFFIPLFCIYLAMPLLAYVRQDKKVKIFSYIMIAGFAVNIFIPFILKLINRDPSVNLAWRYSLPVVLNYMWFVFAGYVLHKVEIPLKFRLVIYALAIAGLLVHILGTVAVSDKAGKIDDFYKGYENLPCVLYSMGIFVFVKYGVRKISTEKLDRVVFRLQKYTLEMYLLHRLLYPFISDIIVKNLKFIDRASLGFTFTAALILIPLCILITFILRKIPIVKYIVP